MRCPPWIALVLAYLAWATLRAHRPPPVSAEVRARAARYGVEHDPRRMSARELRQLPGVGHALARVVVEAREGHRGPEALLWEDVPGIGPKRAAEIRAWCAARGVAAEPLVPALGPVVDDRYSPSMSRLAQVFVWSLAALLTGCGSSERAPSARAEAPQAAATSARPLALCGGSLHALEAGTQGQPLVLLLHGMRYTARTWDELGTLQLLAELGCHAVALDWPGYGATPAWDGEPDAPTLLTGVADELGAERVVLIGASMGGGSALELLARLPERVTAFVGLAPAGSASFAPERWSTPTLLLWGENDAVLPLTAGRALAERLGARLEVLSGAAHAAYLEQPDRFHAVLAEFLGAHLPGPPGR
jgi:abhydrolase domain-containing protein 14